jgi:pilus assembly protein Flp/PilA
MINLYSWLKARAATQDRGATAVEYGLIVALIAAVIVVVVMTLGGQIAAAFQTVSDCLGGGTCPGEAEPE